MEEIEIPKENLNLFPYTHNERQVRRNERVRYEEREEAGKLSLKCISIEIYSARFKTDSRFSSNL
jgi:hypothetical protein